MRAKRVGYKIPSAAEKGNAKDKRNACAKGAKEPENRPGSGFVFYNEQQ